ncbi:glycerol ethanol, ferric requiring protein [Rhizina undulata]
MTESVEMLFKECKGGADFNGLCEMGKRWQMIFSLTIATLMHIFFVIISYGCKVPTGIFVPSMAIGASFGRTVGLLVRLCMKRRRICITPGTYVFLGAAAALSGIMHIVPILPLRH